MADYVATAGGNTDNAKAQALNNIAQTGQSQSSAFGQAAANDAAAKTAALKSAMAMAALRGAPSGNVAQGQATISAPLDQRATTLGTIGANYAQNNANRAQNFGQFFDLTKAGLPIAQTRLDQTVKGLQEKAAEKAAALASAAQARNDAHNLAVMRMQAAADKQSAAQKPETLGQFLSGQGGADLVGDQIKSIGDAAKNNALHQSMNDSTTGYDQGNDWYGDAVQGTPIPRSLADTLVRNSQAKDVTQPDPKAFAEGATDAQGAIKSGVSYDVFAKSIYGAYDPATADAIVKTYGPQVEQAYRAAHPTATPIAVAIPTTPTTRPRVQ